VERRGYWCLTERFVDQYQKELIFIRYEKLCEGLEEYLNPLLPDDSGVRLKREDFLGESHTSSRKSDQQLESRIYGWKEELTRSQVSQVEDTVRMFGMDEALIE